MFKSKTRPVRNATVLEAVIMVVFMVASLAIGNGIFNYNIRVMLVACVFVDMFIAKLCGRTWKETMNAVGPKIGAQTDLFFTLLGIGFLIGTWVFSGTVPVIAAWLVGAINPKFTLLLTFLFGWIISFIIGSNFTTGGTICLIMFNIAIIQGIPAPLAAGAAVCGATAGSFISPIYNVPVLSASLLGYEPTDSVKQMAPPVFSATALTSIFFLVAGFVCTSSVDSAAITAQVEEFTTATVTYFNSSILVLLPVLIVLIGSIASIPSSVVLFGSGACALVVGMILNGFSLDTAMSVAWGGFNSGILGDNVPEILAKIVGLGGMSSLLNGMIFIILSLICAGIMSYLGVFELIGGSFEKRKTVGSLNLSAALYTMLATLVTTDTSPAFVITAETLPKYYARLGVSPKKVMDVQQCNSRFLTSTMPWCFNAVYMATLYGLTVWDYLPFAVFFPLVALCQIVLTYFGVGVSKITREEAERFGVNYDEIPGIAG